MSGMSETETPKAHEIVAALEQAIEEAPDPRAIERAAGEEKIASGLLKKAMLEALGQYGNVTRALEEVGRQYGVLPSRLRVGKWVRTDKKFRERYVAAAEEYADRLEEAARMRAVEGWEEPVYQRGELVGSIRKYSDPLLQMLLKGARPQRYRDVVGVQHETAQDRREALNKELARLSLIRPEQIAEASESVVEAEVVSAEDAPGPDAPTE